MYRIITLKIFIIFMVTNAMCIEVPVDTHNKIYKDNIKTVEMYRDGWNLSNPIINLGSDEQLVFSFDDLTITPSDYYYTFYHCDRSWNPSSIAQQEYFESFTEFPISDFEYSENTTMPYINYMFRIPNDDVPIVLSGNYLLIVYARDEPMDPVIVWRFYVVEPKVTINARIRQAAHGIDGVDGQEVDFTVSSGRFNIDNPDSDIKVVVQQNNRFDNQSDDLRPLFINNGMLEYDYSSSNVFPAVNEFRFFEFRDRYHLGRGVCNVMFADPFYNITLEGHKPRNQARYSYGEDLNGNFHIEVLNGEYPEVEADYMFVHFTLDMPQPLLGGGIYVFGKLSNWACSDAFKMKYNMEMSRYELSLLLKQGVYNFLYAYQDDYSGKIKAYNIEGSHSETENDYGIFGY